MFNKLNHLLRNEAIDPAGSIDALPVVETPPAEATDAPVARGDKHIWGIYILLCFISIIELYSASSREVQNGMFGVFGPIVRHGFMLFAGFCIIYYIQSQHYRRILKAIPWFVFISLIFMLITLAIGEDINGARRSFSIMGVSIQPSEFLKISAAMVVALVMARAQIPGGGVKRWGIVTCIVTIGLFCLLLAPQGLTNTLLLCCISGSMMIVGGIGWRRLGIVMVAFAVLFGCYVLYNYIKESSEPAPTELVEGEEVQQSRSRLGVWMERMSNFCGDGVKKYDQPITSDNRQEMLGYLAQAHGGLTGVGPGNSRENARLPLAFTDYVYAIVVEELGLFGGIFVLVLYLWLLARASAIASHCSRAFPAMLVIGMALVIVYQALFHICIVTGVIPVSGQPLPLISKGGTSILITSIAFGIMLSVSRFAVRTSAKTKEIKTEIEALPEDMRADNPTTI